MIMPNKATLSEQIYEELYHDITISVWSADRS